MKEAIEYLLGVVYDDLGLDDQDAVEVLAATIVEIANKKGNDPIDLLERANEVIANG